MVTALDTMVPVAEGAIGRVYRARDAETGEEVAVKVLRAPDESQIARLKREAAAQQRLSHRHIARVKTLERDDDGQWRLVMEYVAGSTLAREFQRLTLEQRVALLETTCRAVAHAHDAGILHRDLKPANILLRDRGDDGWEPVVADFGLAIGPDDPAMTTTGEILGSPAYMSPEQARGDPDAVGPASDVFSVGCMLYEALTGKVPFEGPSVSAGLERLLNEDPAHPRRVNPHAPEPLCRIALQCLERDPARRYPGAEALADDLARWRRGEPVAARAYTRLYRLRRRVARHPAASALGAAALVAIAALSVWGAWTASTAALREASAAELGTALADMKSRMIIARLAPIHDIGRDRQALREALVALRASHVERSATSDLLHATLASGYLEIGDVAAAERHAERALALRDTPANRTIRARTLLARYATTVAPLMDLPPAQRDERLEAARADLLAPAEKLVEPLQGTRNAPTEALARLAVVERRFDEAASRIGRLARDNPQDYTPVLLAAALEMERAEAALADGERAEAARRFEAAQDSFERITAIGRSDPRPRLHACRAARGALRAKIDRGGPFPDGPAELAAGCAELLVVDPANPDVHTALATVHNALADAHEAINDGDAARRLVHAGLEATDRALDLAPDDAAALEQRARLYLRLAGLEPEPWTRAQAHFDEAAEAARRLEAARPGYPVGQLLRALIERDRARHLELHGRSEASMAALGRAQQAFEAVLEQTPDSVVALSGAALNAVFHFYEYRPSDPPLAVSWMQRAIALQERALAQDPENVDLLFDQGANHGDLWFYVLLTPAAATELDRSREQLLERAMGLLGRIRDLAPTLPSGYSQPIMILLSGAGHELDHGREAGPWLARAQALQQAADRAGVTLNRNIPAWIQLARARNAVRAGENAAAIFDEALAAMDAPVVDDADRFYLRMHRLELVALYQRWRRTNGLPPDSPRLEQARSALETLLANDRRQAGVLCNGGRLLLEEALAGLAEAEPALQRAEALIEECLATDADFEPRFADDLRRVRDLRADVRAAHDGTATPVTRSRP